MNAPPYGRATAPLRCIGSTTLLEYCPNQDVISFRLIAETDLAIKNSLRLLLRSLRLGGECFQANIHGRDAEIAPAPQRKTEIRTLRARVRIDDLMGCQ